MKKAFKILVVLIIIAGIVAFAVEYQKKNKIEKHAQLIENQIKKEKSLNTSDLKKYITFTKDEVNTNTTTQKFSDRWEADDNGFYFVPGNSLTRIDGSTINFYVTNYLKHTSLEIQVKVGGTTYRKNQDNDFIYPATDFWDYVNVSLKPNSSKKTSKFFDTYVYPEPQNGFARIGGLFADLFASSDSKAKESQPINPSTVKFTIIKVNKKSSPNYPEKYKGWLSVFD
jgi:hypothetical protein